MNGRLQLTAVGDDDLLLGGTVLGALGLHLLDDLRALDHLQSFVRKRGALRAANLTGAHLAKDDVLAVEPGSGSNGDEELAAIGYTLR